MDEETKKSAEEVLNGIGMSMTTAVTIFRKAVAREKRIPFEISANPYYSEDNMHYLEQKRKA
ncbi:MAG: type II toxin-antitoxin system RelB/DinJ family antitoxin [Eubacteriales bacterium]|nr:type II toxin-antitoxin system RelB/DinJ family antitoxin [Eubacteriales bacterium]